MVVPPPDMVHNKCQVRAAIRVELSAMANGTNGTGLRVAIVAPDGLVRDGVLHLLSRHRFEIVAEGTASVACEGTPSLSPDINLRRPWLSLHGKSAPTQAAEGSATARPHEGLRSPCRPPGYQRCRLQ